MKALMICSEYLVGFLILFLTLIVRSSLQALLSAGVQILPNYPRHEKCINSRNRRGLPLNHARAYRSPWPLSISLSKN